MPTTTTNIPSAIPVFYSKVFLKNLTPNLVLDKFAQIQPLPKKNSDQIKFRRYNDLSAVTTPLTEGTTPSETIISVTDITATVDWYGAYTTFTDKVTLINPDPVLTQITEVFARQARLSIDTLIRDVVANGTQVRYAGGVAGRSSVAAAISKDDLDEAINMLMNNNAEFFNAMVKPSQGYNTTPIPETYWGIVHPKVYKTLKGLDGWIPVQQYASQTETLTGEVGAYENVRFVVTTNAPVWAGAGSGGADVYGTLIFARDGYGIIPFGGKNNKPEIIIHPLGSAGSADPLNQRGSIGWKIGFTTKILADECIVRIETTE